MNKRKIALIATLLALALLCACAGGGAASPVSPPPGEASGVVISFDFARQSGYASNQFAVWIEDAGGNYIKTLYATRYTASGGYKNRPDSIPLWVERSDPANMADVDAVTGPTPKAGEQSFIWDCTDASGAPVPAGTYKYFVEGSLRWKNRVLYSGEIGVGGGAAESEAQAEYFYEASEDQPALDASAVESGMIGAVRAVYAP